VATGASAARLESSRIVMGLSPKLTPSELSAKGPGAKLHHRDIVGVALRRMSAELHSDLFREVVDGVLREITKLNHHEP
jgi:hypothetical protein